MTKSFFITLIFLLLTSISFAHPGRKDSSGGHNCRTNCKKWGYAYGYHSHGSSRQSSKRSTYSPTKTSSYYPNKNTYKSSLVSSKKVISKKETVYLVGVTDGDTIKVIKDGHEQKVRLYGIDTPENGQAFGKKSKKILQNMLKNTDPKIEIKDKDKYGRLVANVWLNDWNVNQAMVSSGYAWVYRKYCKDNYCKKWLNLEEQARESKKGLWIESSPVPPWEWRKRK